MRKVFTAFASLAVFGGGCSEVNQPEIEPSSALHIGADHARPWTEAEKRAACNHEPGARMRLYGCPPDPNAGVPLLIIDGVEHPPIESASEPYKDPLSEVPLGLIETLEVIKAPEAVARYGPSAEHGVVLVTTNQPVGDAEPQIIRSRSESRPNNGLQGMEGGS